MTANSHNPVRSSRAGLGGRRGTVLVFVLAILTLLFFIGFALLANTRSQRLRFSESHRAVDLDALMNGMIDQVRMRLRDDVWGRNDLLLDNDPERFVERNPAGTDDLNDWIDNPGGIVRDTNGDGVVEFFHATPESDEPFDAPGPWDRWLGATLPYRMTNSAQDPSNIPTGTIVWPRVSYLGADIYRLHQQALDNTDVLYASPKRPPASLANPNYNAYNVDTVIRVPADDAVYGMPIASILEVVPIWDANSAGYHYQAGWGFDRLPRSFSVAQGRALWDGDAALLARFPDLDGVLAGVQAFREANPTVQFPYFDADLDGFMNLHDADGDGVPDSPLSFELPYFDPQLGGMRNLYAAIRIVDHNSMLNVNTAHAFDARLPYGQTAEDEFFNGNGIPPLPDHELRGRRVNEIVLDPEADYGYLDNTDPFSYQGFSRPLVVGDLGAGLTSMLDFRSAAHSYLPDASDLYGFYGGIARCIAIGGTPYSPSGSPFGFFGLADEASLRYRFNLTPRALVNALDTITDPTAPEWDQYPNIERPQRGLPNTLHWSQEVDPMVGTGLAVGDYNPTPDFPVRWAGLDMRKYKSDAGIGIDLLFDDVDGYAAADVLGYRQLYNQGHEMFARRPLYTAVSFDTTRMPTFEEPIDGDANLDDEIDEKDNRPMNWGLGGPNSPPTLPPNMPPPGDWLFLAPSGNWVTLTVPPSTILRTEKIDLNQGMDENDDVAVAEWLGWLTWAIYWANPEIFMKGVADPTTANNQQPKFTEDGPGAGIGYGRRLRLRRALQLAANILDYRDSNIKPTLIVNEQDNVPSNYNNINTWPKDFLYMPVVGLEPQPFITEVLSWMQGTTSNNDDVYAIEIYNPYQVSFPADALRLYWTPDGWGQDGTLKSVSLDQANPGAPTIGPGYSVIVSDPDPPSIVVDTTFVDPVTGGQTQEFRFKGSPRPLMKTTQNHVYLTRVIPMIDWTNGSTITNGSPWLLDRMWIAGDWPNNDGTGVGGEWVYDPGPPDTWMTDPGNTTGKHALNSLQRDTHEWRFTTAFAERRTKMVNSLALAQNWINNNTTLGRPNENSSGLNSPDFESLTDQQAQRPTVEAVPWIFANVGLDQAVNLGNSPSNGDNIWAFDSAGDLSRVMAFGTDWEQDIKPQSGLADDRVYDIPNASNPIADPRKLQFREMQSATEWLHRTQYDVLDSGAQENQNRRMAVGRVNWFEPDQPFDGDDDLRGSGRLLWFLTCNTLEADEIDNDGDGIVDEPGEAAAMFYRNAGLLNLNTAPGVALRGAPFMQCPERTGTYGWDFAARIQAWRERREVQAVNGFDAAPAGPDDDKHIFRSVMDLRLLEIDNAEVSPAQSRRDITTLCRGDGVPSREHSQTDPIWSPDFDRALQLGEQNITNNSDRVDDDFRSRDMFLSRWANLLTVRSDVYTAYIALFDEHGRVVRRTQVTLDRSPTVANDPVVNDVNTNGNIEYTEFIEQAPLPAILLRRELDAGTEAR